MLRISSLARPAALLLALASLMVLGGLPLAGATGLPATTVPCAASAGSSGGIQPMQRSTGGTSIVVGTPTGTLGTFFPHPAFPMSVTPGKVTVAVGSMHYGLCDTIQVGIANGLLVPIFTTNGRTSCSLVTLERYTAGKWQPVGGCRMGVMSRLITIASGSVIGQSLRPSSGFGATTWPAGMYRVVLGYWLGTAAAAPSTGVHSIPMLFACSHYFYIG